MMDAPMKLLVYAIVTAMIISLLYIFVFPLAFRPQNSVALIERNLAASETGLGKGFSVEIIAGQGNGFMGETFDSSARNAIFRCNSASQCCPQGEKCNLAIEWNDRMVKFNNGTAVTVTTRCKSELGLYLCTIYFGEKPAQIEIDSLDAPESVDLGKESLSFEVAFSNKGEQEAFETEVSAEIFRRYLVQGSWVEKKIENASKAYSFGGLKHDETRAERIIVPLNENGSFKAKIRASGLEAGFDERIVEFSATGAIGQCYAEHCDQPRLIEGKCAARCYCNSCLYGGACAEKILQSDNITLGLDPEISLQNAEAEILGSDIVDLGLPVHFCPSDEIIEEPNAIANEIGFKVKNILENRVQNRFTVKAYLEHGSAGQSEIGSAEVQPNEINDNGSVIKAITVDLIPGTYAVKLVANEARTEREENYANNSADVTVKIAQIEKSSIDSFLNPPWGRCCHCPITIVSNPIDDGTGVIPLREAIKQGKIKADFKVAGHLIYFRAMNMTNQLLKIKISAGQIFIPQNASFESNLGKGYESKGTELAIILPVCAVYIGNFKAYYLNRSKREPDNLYNLGEVTQDSDILWALKKENQGLVWDIIERKTASPNSFGSSGEILAPNPITALEDTPLSTEQCKEAGLEAEDCEAHIIIIPDPAEP